MFPMVENQEHQWKSIIKLKIPKSEVKLDHNDNHDQYIFGFEDEEKGQFQNTKDNNISRICHVCSKGFSSGKALGGHMRIHVLQEANKELFCGKKRKELNQEVDMKEKGNNNIQEPICSLCGKNFPSMKSLFGHMRCHPDRHWRGIQPPTTNHNTTSWSSDRNDSATTSVDLSKVVGGGGWSVTAKRSRKSIDCGAINSEVHLSRKSSSEEKQLCDAVHYLMLLAYGDSFKSDLTGSGHYKKENPAYKAENNDANVISGTRRRTVEEMTQLQSNSCVDAGERNTVYPARKSVRMDYSDDEAGSNIKSEAEKQVNSKLYETTDNNTSMFVKMKSIKRRRRRKKMKLKHLGSLQDAASNNTFPQQNTMQVTPDDINYRSSDSTIIVPMDGSTEEAVACNSKLLLDSTNEYKIFSSTQTLGGHKICEYWNSRIDDQPQLSSSQVSSLGEVRNTSGPRILDFDLNELALPEDETGCNHGWVSYSSF